MLRILCILCLCGLLPSPLFAESTDKAEPAKADAKPDPAAQETFDKSLAAMETRQSVQAKLQELVNIGDHPLRMTGEYFERAGKTHLELKVGLPGDVKGALLEISDGEILWTQTEFPQAKAVTLRNLKQIAEVFEEQPELVPAGGKPELGLGGLAGLMTSLKRTMDFDQRREEVSGDVKLVVIQGKWKPEFASQWRQKPDDPLPHYLPDLLRISFDADTLFPRRFLYLKKNPEKETYRPLVRLEFQDIQLDQPIDEAVFQFTPPEDVVPSDVTKQYIEQLKQKHAQPAQSSPPGGK